MNSRRWVWGGLIVGLVLAAALELSLGPLSTPPGHIPGDIAAYFRGGRTPADVVMGAIRLPRLLVAVLVGAGLAMSGAVLQAIFLNPMADPSIIGVSSGGALGAVLTVQAGGAALGPWAPSLGAFAGGMAAVGVIYRLATRARTTSIYFLLLAGVAISALASAIMMLILSLDPLQTMQQVLFWLMGGLDGSGWVQVAMLTPLVIGSAVFFLSEAPALDLLSLGEEQAQGAGVAPQRTKQRILAATALVVGASVSTTGVIAFIGLVVPHLLRLLLGPAHRGLILASGVGGAMLLVAADLVARMVLSPIELNVGIVTSCLGAPFFLFLLRRQEAHGYGEQLGI